MTDRAQLPPVRVGLPRILLRLALLFLLAYCVHLVVDWMLTQIEGESLMRKNLMLGVLTTLLLAYALIIAVPFMPGIEIGISLLVLRGAEIAPFVYFATLAGLIVAYAAGRWMPYAWLHSIFADLRLRRACNLIDDLAPMSREDRVQHLLAAVPAWLRPVMGRGRYVLLPLLINMPGNVVLGGGGGIAFAAGFSRLFHSLWTIAILALAVLPVPLAVWLYGASVVE